MNAFLDVRRYAMIDIRGKKILIITHQLSETGAPFALLEFMEAAIYQGADLQVISMSDGVLSEELKKRNIPYLIKSQFMGEEGKEFVKRTQQFDLVVVNTLLTYEVIHLLKNTFVPVIWWIHEGENYFNYFKDVLPDFKNIGDNIFIYAVSPLVAQIFQKQFDIDVEILSFGITEEVRETSFVKHDKIKFLTAGTYSYLKGQDILIEAIQDLDKEILNQCEFHFCGSEDVKDEEIFNKITEAAKQNYPIEILPFMKKQEFLQYLETMDCLIVPSRLDTVSSVAVEMLMKEGVCICSDTCGISSYMEKQKIGLIFKNENVKDLADKIKEFYLKKEFYEGQRAGAKKVFQTYFSIDVFYKKVKHILETTLAMNQNYYKTLECINQDRWDEALTTAVFMLERPFCDKVAVLLAYINFYFGDKDSALSMIQRGMEYNHKNYELYFMLGNYYRPFDTDKALFYYKQAYCLCEDVMLAEDRLLIWEAIEQIGSAE